MNTIQKYIAKIEKGCGTDTSSWIDYKLKLTEEGLISEKIEKVCKKHHLCPICEAKPRTIKDILKLVSERIDEFKKQLLNDFKTPLSKMASAGFIKHRIEELKQKLHLENGI